MQKYMENFPHFIYFYSIIATIRSLFENTFHIDDIGFLEVNGISDLHTQVILTFESFALVSQFIRFKFNVRFSVTRVSFQTIQDIITAGFCPLGISALSGMRSFPFIFFTSCSLVLTSSFLFH